MRPLRPDDPYQREMEVGNVRIRVYFGVLGSEAAVNAFAGRVALEKSLVKELGAKRSAEHKHREPSRWMWRTDRAPIDPEHFEDELEAFVVQLLDLSHAFETTNAGLEERVVTVIVQSDEREPQTDILLSSRTIQALATLNAAFDVDNVGVMD